MKLSDSGQRFLDLLIATILAFILVPVGFFLSVIALFAQGLPILYVQKRVGRNGRIFSLYKFRTMRNGNSSGPQITIGSRDSRITSWGYYLRKSKLDELPQLMNVFKGDMSFVGPRPEVERYVSQYSESQKKVLSIKPGITDWASIEFKNENDILAKSSNPEQAYIEEIVPKKIELNSVFIEKRTLGHYLKIMWKTVF
jgi:lipopolysaccharide/colanic/teichoic acid biosynthesis glycosyltransferase